MPLEVFRKHHIPLHLTTEQVYKLYLLISYINNVASLRGRGGGWIKDEAKE